MFRLFFRKSERLKFIRRRTNCRITETLLREIEQLGRKLHIQKTTIVYNALKEYDDVYDEEIAFDMYCLSNNETPMELRFNFYINEKINNLIKTIKDKKNISNMSDVIRTALLRFMVRHGQ